MFVKDVKSVVYVPLWSFIFINRSVESVATRLTFIYLIFERLGGGVSYGTPKKLLVPQTTKTKGFQVPEQKILGLSLDLASFKSHSLSLFFSLLRSNIQENVDLIKLQRDMKDKATKFEALQGKYLNLEEVRSSCGETCLFHSGSV